MTKEELEKEAEEYLKKKNYTSGHIGYFASGYCKQAYIDSAEPREKQIQIDAEQIRALQKQNGELTDKVKTLEEALKGYKKIATWCDNCEQLKQWKEEWQDQVQKANDEGFERSLLTGKVKELEAQIEKMKCCSNCENGELSAHEEPCLHCQRCFASKDITDQENVKDSWKAIKEIKEND